MSRDTIYITQAHIVQINDTNNIIKWLQQQFSWLDLRQFPGNNPDHYDSNDKRDSCNDTSCNTSHISTTSRSTCKNKRADDWNHINMILPNRMHAVVVWPLILKSKSARKKVSRLIDSCHVGPGTLCSFSLPYFPNDQYLFFLNFD